MSVAAPVSSVDKSVPAANASAPTVPARLPLVSFGAVVLFWTVTFIVRALEIPFFFRFLFGMAAPFLLFLFFNGWWWSRRRIHDRFFNAPMPRENFGFWRGTATSCNSPMGNSPHCRRIAD